MVAWTRKAAVKVKSLDSGHIIKVSLYHIEHWLSDKERNPE